MSEAPPPNRPLPAWISLLILGVLSVFAVGAVVYASPRPLLAAEFGVGLLASSLAFGRITLVAGLRGQLRAVIFSVTNAAAVGGACVVLGSQGNAWLLAIPPALLAPRAALRGDRGALAYVCMLAAAAVVGCARAGADVPTLFAVALSVLAAGGAPLLSFGALEVREELNTSRFMLDELVSARASAEAGALRLKAKLRDDNRRFSTEAELTARFERQFAEVEARHDQILVALVDAVLTVDARGIITSANPACEGVFRAVRDQIIGWPLVRFLPQATVELLGVVYAGKGRVEDTARELRTREMLCMRHDGSSIDVELGVGAFTDKVRLVDGEGEVFSVILRDISARKRMARMKDELISTVSHELRTPLTAIIGSIGLLNGGASGPMPRGAQKLLSVAERNGQRLLTLIEDILDIQKMEAGKLEFAMDIVELGEVVSRAVDTTRPMGAARKIKYSFRNVSGLPAAWADAGRIEQVVANLLSNATKHSPPEGLITVGVDSPEEGRLRVQVIDEGPGIADSQQSRVFERFEQGDMGDTRQSGGTGLGLAIARAIVERHGGEIGVESEPGKGANFYFEIPTAAALGRSPEGTQAPSSVAATTRPDGTPQPAARD